VKDRCFHVPAKDGGYLRIRAAKRPTGKTLVALQNLFDAAYRYLESLKEREMTTEEAVAAEGLDLDGFHFKWKRAKEYELNSPRTDDTRLLPYWERVRLTFLELGGELKGQKYGERV
jgi:hypothetical protein